MLLSFEIITLSLIIGGMVCFQCLFAPMLFTQLEMATARRFIRSFFPFYYLYFGVIGSLLLGISIISQTPERALYYGACVFGFVISRQWLMPAANKATDNGHKKAFDRYHRGTVLINTVQLITYLVLLWQLS